MNALITLLILGLVAALAGAVRRVPAEQVHSIYRRGKPHRLLQPGTHFVLPLIDHVEHRVNLSGQVLRFQEAMANAHDVRGTVYWQVLEPERAESTIDQVEQLIRGNALAALRQEPEAYSADRRDLGTRLKRSINSVLRERGMMVTRVELDFA